MLDGADRRVKWVRMFLTALLLTPLGSGVLLVSCSFEASERVGIGTKFHDYSELDSILTTWVLRYPDLVELRQVCDPADEDTSHHIQALVLSDRSPIAESEPRVQLVGAMHGNEELSTELLLVLVEYLLAEYSRGTPSVRNLLDNAEIHVLPVGNPAGFRSGTRFNAAAVDLNRNFPWSWTDLGASGVLPADQWETRALMHDALEKAYTLSVSLHTGSFGISRLWDYTGELSWSWNGATISYTADYFSSKLLPVQNTVASLGEGYRNLLPEAYSGSFFNREGYDWYPAYGTFQDWLYGTVGIPAFTLEIDVRQDFRMNDTDPAVIKDSWSMHNASLLYFLESALETTAGQLMDSATGLPVQGEVFFTPVQSLESRTIMPFEPQVMEQAARSDRNTGSFHAYLSAGTYAVTVKASGYADSEPFAATVPLDGKTALGAIRLLPME